MCHTGTGGLNVVWPISDFRQVERCCHKNSALHTILSRFSPVHILTPYGNKLRFKNIPREDNIGASTCHTHHAYLCFSTAAFSRESAHFVGPANDGNDDLCDASASNELPR